MSIPRDSTSRPRTAALRPGLAVLFVDPDVETAERLAQSLPNLSAVAVVPTAQEAVAAITMRVPDLIVTELDLPDANGVRLIRSVHDAPLTRRVLILVVTRRTSFRDKIDAFQAGADDYLVKPVDPEQLATHVRLVSRFRQILSS
ncbi:MAG TPA: response regulator [Ktedonobacterales bacterium]